MNSINLVGRLTTKPELKFTSSNKAVCEFSIAVNRIGTDKADFINCQVWGTQAENLTKYQDKGSLIGIVGSLRVDQYKDKDGNKRYKTYVLANNVEYLGTKKEGQPAEQAATTDPFADFGAEISNDDNWLD